MLLRFSCSLTLTLTPASRPTAMSNSLFNPIIYVWMNNRYSLDVV